jgi:transposase
MLKEEVDYKDLGGDYFQKRSEEKTTRRLVRQLEQFGYQVELKRLKAAA